MRREKTNHRPHTCHSSHPPFLPSSYAPLPLSLHRSLSFVSPSLARSLLLIPSPPSLPPQLPKIRSSNPPWLLSTSQPPSSLTNPPSPTFIFRRVLREPRDGGAARDHPLLKLKQNSAEDGGGEWEIRPHFAPSPPTIHPDETHSDLLRHHLRSQQPSQFPHNHPISAKHLSISHPPSLPLLSLALHSPHPFALRAYWRASSREVVVDMKAASTPPSTP